MAFAALLVVAAPLAAQNRPEPDLATLLRQDWTQISGYVTRSAGMVPAARYSYQPMPTVRTYAQLIGHLADSFNYYCARARGRNVEWADPVEKGPQDKATLTRALAAAVQGCQAAYAGNNLPPITIENLTHTHQHYGNIVTYLRMMSLVPPSSAQP